MYPGIAKKIAFIESKMIFPQGKAVRSKVCKTIFPYLDIGKKYHQDVNYLL